MEHFVGALLSLIGSFAFYCWILQLLATAMWSQLLWGRRGNMWESKIEDQIVGTGHDIKVHLGLNDSSSYVSNWKLLRYWRIRRSNTPDTQQRPCSHAQKWMSGRRRHTTGHDQRAASINGADGWFTPTDLNTNKMNMDLLLSAAFTKEKNTF